MNRMVSPCRGCQFEKESKLRHPECKNCQKISHFQEVHSPSSQFRGSEGAIFGNGPVTNGGKHIIHGGYALE